MASSHVGTWSGLVLASSTRRVPTKYVRVHLHLQQKRGLIEGYAAPADSQYGEEKGMV